MEVIWRNGSATVAQVADAFHGKEGSAYTTVLTMMRILRKKGYLTCVKRGRAHVFTPRINRHTAARKALQRLLGKFFDDSPGELVLNFLRHEDLNAQEIEELKRTILKTTDNDSGK